MNGHDLSTTMAAPLCYLGTPYTKFKPNIICAYEEACQIAAALLSAGVKVYSPIAHTHGLAIHGNLDPLDHKIWLPFDEAMMNVCDVLIVAQMPGWDESFGIAHEIDFFTKANKPIFDLDPVSMTMTRRKVEVNPPKDQRPLLSPESKASAA